MEPIDLGDGLAVWIDERGMLGYAIDQKAEWGAYYKLRAKLARTTLKAAYEAGGEPYGASQVKRRVADFERILSQTHAACPEEWRAAVFQLRARKERLFDRYTEAQRRAKAWHRAQSTALAAD